MIRVHNRPYRPLTKTEQARRDLAVLDLHTRRFLDAGLDPQSADEAARALIAERERTEREYWAGRTA